MSQEYYFIIMVILITHFIFLIFEYKGFYSLYGLEIIVLSKIVVCAIGKKPAPSFKN